MSVIIGDYTLQQFWFVDSLVHVAKIKRWGEGQKKSTIIEEKT